MNIIDVHFRIILATFIVAVLLMLTACTTDQQAPEIGWLEDPQHGRVTFSAIPHARRRA